MYVRPPSYKYPSGMRLPENYSGNTFRDQPQEESQEEEAATATKVEDSAQTAALLTQKSGFGLRLGSLFGNKGIGSEELLILALILLLADSDGSEDLVLFLVLLFFIK